MSSQPLNHDSVAPRYKLTNSNARVHYDNAIVQPNRCSTAQANQNQRPRKLVNFTQQEAPARGPAASMQTSIFNHRNQSQVNVSTSSGPGGAPAGKGNNLSAQFSKHGSMLQSTVIAGGYNTSAQPQQVAPYGANIG